MNSGDYLWIILIVVFLVGGIIFGVVRSRRV